MKKIEKTIALILLIFAVGCNLKLYRAEPTTTIDPNDNAFQFALVERTNDIWNYADRTCPKTITSPICHISYLIDHWVPNWAQGYNLPYYYSHVPQIVMVAGYRLLSPIISHSMTLFQYYHLTIYLLLSLFPLSMFLAFRILKFPWLTAGIAALFASLISTDGLYGIDQTSFLWRGWGLSSQLFALIWLPLAIASVIQWTKEASRKLYIFAVCFLALTTMGHLGIGMMAFLALPVICLAQTVLDIAEKEKLRQCLESLVRGIKQTIILAIPPLVILSYWIVPAFLNNNFHNISFWDPVWKFNSFGAKDAVAMFVNGTLFDFSRFPILTILITIGAFVVLFSSYSHLTFLFLFFLVLFFGRTTWGGLLNIIPGMSEFHQHRFIVGIHMAGLFLAPIGLVWLSESATRIVNRITKKNVNGLVLSLFISGAIYIFTIPHILSYASYNTTLIKEANTKYQQQNESFTLLLATLKELERTNPGRVYALRGNEGKVFEIASTPYHMQLSTYGIPTVMWLPETWSMNSDTEQFFSEENPDHYALYNIRYIVAPPTKKPQVFWKLLKKTNDWNLYETNTHGYIGVGTAPSVVSAQKTNIINLVHLWIQSDYPKKQLFPELRMTKDTSQEISLPRFRMTDPVTYITPDNIVHNLFNEPPIYENPMTIPKNTLPMVLGQSNDADMRFVTRVTVSTPCPTCVVVLKQTYHPNWTVTVNGKHIQPIIVFPFYIGVRLESPGTYDITFTYTPSVTKILLLVISCVGIGIAILLMMKKK
jgi:hypothetical protein